MKKPAEDLWQEAFIGVDPGAVAKMKRHWQLLQTWNRRVNLTAIDDENDAIWLHYRDSLAALSQLEGRRVLDIGSGAGFPGLVLALADPTLEVTLMEPRQRRASFLEVAAAALNLTGLEILRARVEDAPCRRFDHAVTRATFSAPDFAAHALKWVLPSGTLICFRGAESEPWGRRHAYTLPGARREARARWLDVMDAPAAAGAG